MELSERINKLQPSATLAAGARAKQLLAEGVDIINLSVGEPNFVTPRAIRQMAATALMAGEASFYTASGGTATLKAAIGQTVYQNYGFLPDPSEVIVTNGAKFALFALFQTILNPGDEVLIPVPFWVSYAEQGKLAAGVPQLVPTKVENQFKVTVEQLNQSLNPQVKALLLNSPNNPTGAIYTKAELLALANWAVAHNVWLIADDIYDHLVYNGAKITHLASLSADIRAQTVTINGLSKTYAMTGWRLGYAVGPADIIAGMTRFASQSVSNPVAISQIAATKALTGEQSSIETMRHAYETRLNTIYPLFEAIPEVTVMKPQGAFYLFLEITAALRKGHYQETDTWTRDLLEKGHVALVSGSAFGLAGYVRLSYSNDLAALQEGIRRIKQFIEESGQ